MKHISVIIPTYQEEAFIGACLDSVLRQEYDRGRFELILSDASSSDRTVAIARTKADKVVVGPKRGIGNGRNEGARIAEGEILLFVDADTTLAPDFLRMIEDTFSNQDVVGATGLPLPADGKWFARFIYRGTYFLVRFFHWLGLSFFPGVCVAYRASTFRQVSGFREDLGISEDLDMSRRIQRLGGCAFVAQARARVSTRRLDKHALSVVLFHIVNDLRYLITGRSARSYPKVEDTSHWTDLWKSNKKRPG